MLRLVRIWWRRWRMHAALARVEDCGLDVVARTVAHARVTARRREYCELIHRR